MKSLRKRFIAFNMLIITCIMLIFVVLVGISERSMLSVNRMVLAIMISIGLVFIGSWFLSKIALNPIKTAWQKQLDFTADASHELRTPLATIQTNLDVVMRNPNVAVESQMKWLKNIAAENKRMSALVSDLLFLSRADTNEIVFEKAAFDLSLLITETLAAYDAAIRQNEIVLQSSIEDGIVFNGDRNRLKQLFVILLDNAIKYNREDGSLAVTLFVDKNIVHLKVLNTGTGIATNEINKLFNRFYRGEKSRLQNPDGSGLGLPIAKMIAEEHDGSIGVKSQIGEWSEFMVRLPLNT